MTGSPRAPLPVIGSHWSPLRSTGDLFVSRSNFRSVFRYLPSSLLLRQSGRLSVSVSSRILLSVVLVIVSMSASRMCKLLKAT